MAARQSSKPASWLEYAQERLEVATIDKEQARAVTRGSSIVGQRLLGIEIELNRIRFALQMIKENAPYK